MAKTLGVQINGTTYHTIAELETAIAALENAKRDIEKQQNVMGATLSDIDSKLMDFVSDYGYVYLTVGGKRIVIDDPCDFYFSYEIG